MDPIVSLLIIIVIIAVIFYVLQQMPVPAPWRNILYLVIGLIIVIYLLRMLGVLHI